MRIKRARAHSEGQELAEIERIVQEVIDKLRAGLEVDYSAIERMHRNLLPHLGERLQRLRAVEAAALEARRQPHSTGSPGRTGNGFGDDLKFLREALSGYDILERIHYGGQGVVYRAIQQATKRSVAIKLLLDGPLASDRQRHRFAREVELVSRLRHPNIVTIYESGVVRGRQFLAMEFVDGLPIDDYVLLHDIPIRETVGILRTVCEAVSHAHQHGIIHRDLKPANILVEPEGHPHILDFGLAKDLAGPGAADSPSSVSTDGQIIGTLPYLSPEQARGTPDQVDVRSDIYSLGVVLFELITGGFPYPVDGDPQTVRNNILSREPISLRRAGSNGAPDGSLNSGELNDDLEKIVLKALEKDKSRRYQSAAAFADDLARYLVGDAVEAKAASRSYLLRKTLRKFRVHVAISAGFMVLLVAALIAVTAAWQRAERIGRIAQAGLQMGSFLRLGSVHRDEGRLDQGVAMFEKALEIGEDISTSDPFVLRHLYDAHHRLAEMYFESNRADQATPHCEAAIKLAEDLVRADPQNLQWRRFLGLSYVLRGRMAGSQNEWERALDDYDRAASIYNDLISLETNNLSLKSDLGVVLNWEGLCCRKLKRFDESLHSLTAAHAIFQELTEAEPHVINHIIELSRTEARLAVWHLSQHTVQHDETATDWLKSAENRLVELRDSGRARGREWDIVRLVEHIRKNEKLVLRRAERRAEPPD